MSEEEVRTEESPQAVETAGAESADAPAAGAKLPLSTRLIGGFIDGLIAGVAAAIASSILGFVHYALGVIGGGLAGAAYMLLRDSMFGNGQSIGKKVMKYQVVGPKGNPCTQELSIKRNIPLALASIVSAVLGIIAVVPVLGPIVAGLGSMIAGLLGLAINIAEVYFINSDPKGNRYGDKFAGTTTVPFNG
jgi:uncharacterized RDD family membrane protein YckC